MGNTIKRLAENFMCCGQVSETDIQQAYENGVTYVVCNRPDNEDIDQVSHHQVQQWCESRDMGFSFLPMANTQINNQQLDIFEEILTQNIKILAYCRSGIRSSVLWAVNEVRHQRKTPEETISITCQHGLNIAMIYPLLQTLAK